MANPRYIRDTTILAKIEATSGTDSVPTGAANAMAVSNVKITPLNAQFVGRDLLRNYFGISEQLISSYNKLISFDVEAVGSGTAGTAPAWGPLMRACGFAETLVATERVEYKPVTNGQESCSIYAYDAGILHKFVYCKGGPQITLGLGGIPKISYSFVAIDAGDTAATPAGVSFTGFKVPEVVQDALTGDLILGGTYTPTPGVPGITGGTVYPSKGIEIDTGIKPEFINLLGGQSVDITDRQVKGKVTVDATVAQEIAFYTAVKGTTLQSVGLIHGSVVGRRFGVFGANVQLVDPAKAEMQGKRLIDLGLNFIPGSGNDELTIVTSF